jgi:hypothetical protein
MRLENLKKDIVFFFSEQYWHLFVEFTDKEIAILETGAKNLPRKGFILRLAIFSFGLFRSIAHMKISRIPKININLERPEVLILSGSDNEYRSTKFLEDNNYINTLYCGTIKTNGCAPVQVYLIGALFIPLLIVRFLFSSGEQRNLYKFLSDQFLLVMGWRAVHRDIFRKRNIKTVVYSNHMSPASRSAVALAREYSNARVIYVEHTPILTYWPEVDADVYFLSGQLSLDNMMRRSVINGKDIYLLGSPKNDSIKFKKKNSETRYIGLCVSTADNLQEVKSLICSILSYNNSVNIIVRPHPSFNNFDSQLAIIHPRLLIRSPTYESVQEYLSSIDCMITNDSGIFFEGMLAGVNVYRVKLSSHLSNNYGVPQEFSPIYNKTASEVTSFIFSNDSVSISREEVQFFFGNTATEFEGNASKIVSEVISLYIGTEEERSLLKNRLMTHLSEFKFDGNRIFKLRTS